MSGQPGDMRPYFHESADELESLARTHWDSPEILLSVVVELFHRRTDKARTLRAEFVDRFAQLPQDGFAWPTTDAPEGTGGLEVDSPETGLLKVLGYRVGAKGPPQAERQEILDCVYGEELPTVSSAAYMLEWGEPQTAARLRKLAESIAAYARNAKRRNSDLSNAVREWEADLDFLRRRYYVGRYDFVWPQT